MALGDRLVVGDRIVARCEEAFNVSTTAGTDDECADASGAPPAALLIGRRRLRLRIVGAVENRPEMGPLHS